MHNPEQGKQQHDDTQGLVAKWRAKQEAPADLIYCRRAKLNIKLSECVRYLDSVRHDWGPRDNGGVEGRPTHLAVMACTADSHRVACPYYSKRESIVEAGGRKVVGHDGVIRINGRQWNGKDRSKFIGEPTNDGE